MVKGYIGFQLYFPNRWPLLAAVIGGVMLRDESVVELFLAGGGAADGPDFTEAQEGIKCGDVWSHTDKLDDKLEVFEGRHSISRIMGDSADDIVAKCAQWRMPAKERYMGDFNVETKNPMLIIGNTHDPVTPLASARNLSETIQTSRLLQHDSYGHDSLIIGSLCTAKTIRSYFVEGKLPDEGTVCETHVELFSGTDGWDEIIAELEADPLEA